MGEGRRRAKERNRGFQGWTHRIKAHLRFGLSPTVHVENVINQAQMRSNELSYHVHTDRADRRSTNPTISFVAPRRRRARFVEARRSQHAPSRVFSLFYFRIFLSFFQFSFFIDPFITSTACIWRLLMYWSNHVLKIYIMKINIYNTYYICIIIYALKIYIIKYSHRDELFLFSFLFDSKIFFNKKLL